jgi:hypothetical protein
LDSKSIFRQMIFLMTLCSSTQSIMVKYLQYCKLILPGLITIPLPFIIHPYLLQVVQKTLSQTESFLQTITLKNHLVRIKVSLIFQYLVLNHRSCCSQIPIIFKFYKEHIIYPKNSSCLIIPAV